MNDRKLEQDHEEFHQGASASTSVGTPDGPDAPVAGQVRTPLGALTLSMFEKGQYVRVRVGSAHNATELYEYAYASADEANTALIEAGILTKDQVPDPLELAGTGIQLNDVSAEQLEKAGLKRHLGSNL
ncbi:MAG: hypothetical protein ACRYFU_25770 [Janthinobacterium lividum]